MTTAHKVESVCAERSARVISVERSAKACINCIWYEQYYRQNRGNIKAWIGTDKGFCLLREQQFGALNKPCKSFETKNAPLGATNTKQGV